MFTDQITRQHRLEYSTENCSVKRTVDIIGERWTVLILREAILGMTRFEDFQQVLGCASNILSTRLSKLVEHQLLERFAYREPGSRTRYEYHLTAKGRELFPVLVALARWGDRWTADPDGPPVELLHSDCGAPITLNITCTAGHGPLQLADTHATAGPGARRLAHRP
jgi:DNA-binding HxlR family transcriptional regulator